MHASGKSPTSRQRHASVGVAIPVEMWLGKRPKLIKSGMSLQPSGSAGALAGPSPHSRHRHAAGTSPLPSTHFIPGTSGRQRCSRSGNSRVGHQVLAGQVRGIPARHRPSQVRQTRVQGSAGGSDRFDPRTVFHHPQDIGRRCGRAVQTTDQPQGAPPAGAQMAERVSRTK